MTRPDHIKDLSDWVGRVILRFNSEIAGRGLIEDALVRGVIGGQPDVQLAPEPALSDTAKSAFETALLSEPLPSCIALALLVPPVPESHVRLLELLSSVPVRLRDVPDAVAALRSSVGSSSHPILAYYQSSDDAADVGLTQFGGQGA